MQQTDFAFFFECLQILIKMESRNHLKNGAEPKSHTSRKKIKRNIMKTTFLTSLLLMSTFLTAFSATWTITNSGVTFTPSSVTIELGDSINFNISSMHNAAEVSQATWDANGNTPLPGFSTPFGGGLVLPAKLTAGTHYYVCTPHASIGMKGIIIVQNTTDVSEVQQQTNISVYPNPSDGKFQLTFTSSQVSKNCNLEILDMQGNYIYQSDITQPKTAVDLSYQPSGIYFARFFDGAAILTKKIVIQ